MAEIALPYFVSLPAAEPPFPGVVVVQEGTGMTAQLLRVCERLAAEGYATIAPDLFFRTGGPAGADIRTMMGGLSVEQTSADIEAVAERLRAMGAEKLGITGFCNGGLWTWRMATTSTTFSAAAGFYGAGIAGELAEPNCPTTLFFGDTDEWIPTDQIDQISAAHPDTVVYEGAEHGFMRDGSENFHEAAATDAWSRLLAHFAQHLR